MVCMIMLRIMAGEIAVRKLDIDMLQSVTYKAWQTH